MAHVTSIVRSSFGAIKFYDGETVLASTAFIADCVISGNEIICTLDDESTINYEVADIVLLQVSDTLNYMCSPVTVGSPAYTPRLNDVLDWCANYFPHTPDVAYVDANAGGPGGSVLAKQTEIDFGSTPVYTGTFTVTDADVTGTSQLIAQVAYEAPTGKDLDEVEMDNLDIKCSPGTGQFSMFVTSHDGSYLEGKFKINYLIG